MEHWVVGQILHERVTSWPRHVHRLQWGHIAQDCQGVSQVLLPRASCEASMMGQ